MSREQQVLLHLCLLHPAVQHLAAEPGQPEHRRHVSRAAAAGSTMQLLTLLTQAKHPVVNGLHLVKVHILYRRIYLF